MYVKDRMNKNAVYVQSGSPLSKALSAMKESGHRKLPVVNENGVPVGIIDRQSVEIVGTASFLLSKTKIRDIMSTSFFTVNENTVIEECALMMKENKVSFLPVVSSEGKISGVITSYDVLKGLMKIIDISGEGCRMAVRSTNVCGIIGLMSKGAEIKSVVLDGDTTIIKFYSENGSEVKDRVNTQYDVIYYKEL